jgi:hypothetical protein
VVEGGAIGGATSGSSCLNYGILCEEEWKAVDHLKEVLTWMEGCRSVTVEQAKKCFPVPLFENFHTSLVSMLIYCKYKSFAAIITLYLPY